MISTERICLGFYSAVNIASDAIDCIHTTASSHQRVFIVEVMGHKVGWLTLYAGIASGADVILIPEIPYDIEKVMRGHQQTKRARKRIHHSCRCRGCNCKRRRSTSEERAEKTSGRNRKEIPVRILQDRRRDRGKDRHGNPRHRTGPHAARRQPVSV